jgi:YD repeat-containing protein
VVFTLPVGAYRFRADYDGVPFWSGMENTCTLPECEEDAVTLPGGMGQSQVTIEYMYDALNRLTSATYSNGTAFSYTYDAAGNVLTYNSRHYGLTSTTTYTYDDTNQLLTASAAAAATEGDTTWYYSYDNNGSLVMSSPSQGEANGATRNTYNKAGYLVKVEEHNGTTWQTQAEMRYDGLGNRLEMTSYNEGVGETIRYQLDNGQPLAAVGTESTSYYLYGRGVIGTKTANWGYVLQDGLGSTRQLATYEGVIAMSVAYTPWPPALRFGDATRGDVLEYYGSGGIDFGYLGGSDENTGLIYLGSGQYYDPVTGRMLTRGAGQSNPYKPGAFDPAGMMVAPLAVLGLVLGRKKKRGKWDSLLVLLVMGVVVGMSVSASGPEKSTPTPIPPTQSPKQPPTEEPTLEPDNENNTSAIPTATPDSNPAYNCIVKPTIEIGAIDPIDFDHMWDVLDKPEDRHMYYIQSSFRHAKELPQEIPIELFIAIGWAETGETYYWNNDYIPDNGLRDGIMQVSEDSGFREKWARDNGNGALYNNTPMGIESNVIDAISYLNDLSAHIENYRVGYGNAFDNICESRTIRIVLHYNGGPNPIGIYKSEMGAPKYLERVANNLGTNVPSDIGFDYANPSLVEYLLQGQQVVDNLLDS